MALTLNIAPITIEAERLALGRLPYTDDADTGDLAQVAVAWTALELLTRSEVAAVAPTLDTLVTVLQRTETTLARWVWETSPRTRGTALACWRLDNEYHVQSFLWTALYPIYGPALIDEHH